METKAKKDLAFLREGIKEGRKKPPVRIIVTTPELSAGLVLEAFEKDQRCPYTVSLFGVSEGILREHDAVRQYMFDQLGIALHAETIANIDIVLPKNGYGFEGRDVEKDAQELERIVKEAVKDREIEVASKVDESVIDYSTFDVVLYHCVDYRFFSENVANLVIEKNLKPLVVSCAGAVAVLENRVNGEIRHYMVEQVVRAFKLSRAKIFVLVNHGDGCGGYKHCKCTGAQGLYDIALTKGMAKKILDDAGIYGVRVVSRFQTMEAYFEAEFKDLV